MKATIIMIMMMMITMMVTMVMTMRMIMMMMVGGLAWPRPDLNLGTQVPK